MQPHSFERENRPLSDWLLAIIHPEPAIRVRAGLVISSMHMGITDPNADITPDMFPADQAAHHAAFKAAVCTAVDAPDFPRQAYVDSLMRFIEVGTERFIQQSRSDRKRVDRITAKIEARMADDVSAEKLERENRRLMQTLCAAASSKSIPRLEQAHTWAAIIFKQLDHSLLEAPEHLANWLQHPSLCHSARDALKRIGPAAASFAPQLLAELDACDKNPEAWWWDRSHVLAAIGREDPSTILALVSRLDQSAAIAGNAAATLGAMGPSVLSIAPKIVDRLLMLSRHPVEFVRLASFGALGELGEGRAEVGDRLVSAIREGKNYEPGYALDALGPKVVPAAAAIPLILGQFYVFEEFDCDREYQGDHARLAEALARYGSDAVAALPLLLSHLGDAQNPNESVVEAIGAMGPAAAGAASVLAKVAREAGVEDLVQDGSYLGKAWRMITTGNETDPKVVQ